MSIILPRKLFEALPTHEGKGEDPLARLRTLASWRRDDPEVTLRIEDSDAASVDALVSAAIATGDGKSRRALEAWLDAKANRFDRPLPSFGAFADILRSYLSHDAVRAWVFVDAADGRAYPELVTRVTFDDGKGNHGRYNGGPLVTMNTLLVGMDNEGKVKRSTRSHAFAPADVARRKVADVLAASGIRKETSDLLAAHDADIARHDAVVRDGFGQQFRMSGRTLANRHDAVEARDRKVVHDVEPDGWVEPGYCDSDIMADAPPVPFHPLIRVFDLGNHAFHVVHGACLTPYEYDPTIRDKLVLPRSHHDLLEVLTEDLGAFADDFVEGKRAGNIILLKGTPGNGKTLSAEAYSELMKRPLYSVRAGALGTTAAHVGVRLDTIVRRAARWNCVLLLDEADVFCATRGMDLERDAITAEMLRVLEYLDALLFMTTNRPDDIDEAIVGRCIAIVGYDTPEREHAAAVWTTFGKLWSNPLTAGEALDLADMLPKASARDIKMLFSLTLRMLAKKGKRPVLDDFRTYSMFRGLKAHDVDAKGEWR